MLFLLACWVELVAVGAPAEAASPGRNGDIAATRSGAASGLTIYRMRDDLCY